MAVKRKTERRPYDSSRRRARAREARRRIVESAVELFVDQGYAGTSVRQVAEHAGVSPETVYGAFGTKADLLARAFDIAAVGDDRPITLLQRPWVSELAEEPDLDRRIAILAEHGTEIAGRVAPLLGVARAAARSEPRIAELLDEITAARGRDITHLFELLVRDIPLRPGTSRAEAEDWFATVSGDRVHVELVHERGWTPEQHRAWLARSIRTTLFPD